MIDKIRKNKNGGERMKKGLIVSIMAAAALLFTFNGTAQAIPFTDTVNFSGDGEYDGADYKIIFDMLIWPDFTYEHVLDSVPSGATLNSADLSLTHMLNGDWSIMNFIGEVWYARSGGDIFIGDLSFSLCAWTTDTWTLGSDVLDEISSTDPLSLTVKLSQPMLIPIDGILALDESVLAGDYTPIPEPATMILFGSGLLGLAALRRKRS